MTRLPAVARVVDPNRIWITEPGFYAVRLTKGGVEVGCRIEYGPTRDPETGLPLDRSWLWTATVGDFVEYASPAPLTQYRVGRPISEAEYRYLIDDRAWAKAHAPHLPEADPRRAVALADRPIPFLEA